MRSGRHSAEKDINRWELRGTLLLLLLGLDFFFTAISKDGFSSFKTRRVFVLRSCCTHQGATENLSDFFFQVNASDE